MMRNTVVGILMLTLVLATAGCGGQDDSARHDMPVKASQGVNPKTGKATKTFEASFEDPPRKK